MHLILIILRHLHFSPGRYPNPLPLYVNIRSYFLDGDYIQRWGMFFVVFLCGEGNKEIYFKGLPSVPF